jgi:hypothetical protein
MKNIKQNAVRRAVCTIAMCVWMPFFSATAAARDALKLTDADYMLVDAQLKSALGHPNEEWRYRGLKSYLSGRYGEAVEQFERAAEYADKFSQHYLSLIYWHGQGVAVDRVQAYLWSDLAAERGSPRLLAIREKMWRQLDAAQRAEVEARGESMYQRYGDNSAKPRMEIALRRFASHKTGSRVGYNNQRIDIIDGGPINGSFGNATPGMLAASAAAVGGANERERYGDGRTRPDAYWRDQDRQLDARKTSVEIGPVSKVPKDE